MFKDYIEKLKTTLDQTVYLYKNNAITDYEEAMGQIVNVFSKVKKEDNNLFFIGNGGSAAIASHMTADFMKNGGIKTYSLYDCALTSCMGNDYGYEHIFSKPLSFLINKEDVLVAVSSSGNSPNIVNAINVAIEKKAKIITFSGFLENNMIKQMGDYNIYVPISHYGIIESIHTLILQQIVDTLLEEDGTKL